MTVRSCAVVVCAVFGLLLSPPAPAQPAAPSPNDSVRVNVTMNTDGSRTVYEFDTARHRATATTTAADGKTSMGKIEYDLDDNSRFAAGRIFGADGKLLFKTTYKYDSAGRVEQETKMDKSDKVISKLVYSYDANGKQSGYVVYDAEGKVIGRTTPVNIPGAASATAPPKKGAPRR